MAKTIYAAMADTCYEGSAVIKAFEVRADADRFVKACRDHESKRPQVPDDFNDDAQYEKWLKKANAWARKHPAKPFTAYNIFSVAPLKLEVSNG